MSLIERFVIVTALVLLWAERITAQAFDTYFEDRTLRLDYILAGTDKTQEIYFEKAYKTTRWAGRKARLAELFLRGNGQIILKDPVTGQTLFAHSFSTLFQEWQATEEATRVKKSFELSLQVPFPKQKVDVIVSLTDSHNKKVAETTHTINPSDILIQTLDDKGVPYHYIWKGNTKGDPDVTGCIDLAIVAEGYTASQMDKFERDCQRAVEALFAHEPFQTLKQRFNVIAVASPSEESGPSVPHEGRWHRTAVGTHYDTFYTDRYLMTESMHRMYDVLSGVPFEHIIVMVNTDIYGGGGIFNQMTISTSDNAAFKPVLVHEFGHGYAGLGDEYYYDDQYTSMYPEDTEPWEPNLTTLVDFNSKWADMMPESTKVPTEQIPMPEQHSDSFATEFPKWLKDVTQRVGVFEGGGYQSKGVYRPAQECRMKVNEVEDFCPVCTRAIVRITDFYTSR